MEGEPLVVPLLLKDKSEVSIFIEQACVTSSPTDILSWGLDGTDQPANDPLPIAGAAVGCEDGSVYLFSVDESHTEPGAVAMSSKKHALSIHVASASPAPSSSPISAPSSLKSPPRSRRTSQSMHVPHPLSHQTRSRVMSSVSKTSAEAPKNYADFADEKERLEDIIKKNSPPAKERSVADGFSSSHGVAGLGYAKDNLKTNSGNGGSRRSSKELSFPGNSPFLPPHPRYSLSSPPSPSSVSSIPIPDQPFPTPDPCIVKRVGSAPRLVLRSHIFLSRFGGGHSVTSLKRLTSEAFVCLQKTGNISVISTRSGICIASLDIEAGPRLHPPPPPFPPTFLGTMDDHTIWTWKYLHVAETSDAVILLATASDQPFTKDEEHAECHTRVAVLKLQDPGSLLSSSHFGSSSRHGELQKVGEWIMVSTPETVGLIGEGQNSSPMFFYITAAPSSMVVSHSLQIVPPAFVIAAPVSLQPPPDSLSSTPPINANSSTNTSLPHFSALIPNPFKSKNLESEDGNTGRVSVSGRVVMGSAATLATIPLENSKSLMGIYAWKASADAVHGVLWNDTEFAVFEDRDLGNDTRIHASIPHNRLHLVERFRNDTFVLHQKRRVDVYCVSVSQENSTLALERVSSRVLSKQYHARTAVSSSLLLCSWMKIDSDGLMNCLLDYVPVPPLGSRAGDEQRVQSNKITVRNAWTSSLERSPTKSRRVTFLLPLEIESIIIGYIDGSIGRSSLSDLLTIGWPASRQNNAGINGFIVSLCLINNERTKEKFIVGGSDDGAVAVWDLPTLKLQAAWTIFTEPMRTVIPLRGETIGRLQGCAFCVSDDGTLAVIAIDGLQLLYLIPGSAARLTRLCLGEDNLLLIYADGKARLWDVKTQVFWRSMTSKTADELLRQGNWFQATIGDQNRDLHAASLASMQIFFSSYDAASTLLLDIRALNDLIHPLSPSRLFRDPRREDFGGHTTDQGFLEIPTSSERASQRLKFLKALLGSLLSFGLDNATDEICRVNLGIMPSLAAIGQFSNDFEATTLSSTNALEIWQTSPQHTASQLLMLVTVLRGLLAFDECEPYANQVIAFYVASLQDVVGPLWQAPSLTFLARYWFHSSSEIRLAARALFGAAAGRLSDDDTIRLVEYWQHELPCLQPTAEKQSAYSALALLIAGNIATERYTVLGPSTLTDIAKSITLYLHDETCPHRTLAIDLCSRGFQIWQHYVDAMEVLRALFALSTSAEKERNVGPQARLAVLQIASSNTPLFMTTLSLDILHPQSVQKRKSIMQLVAFLIRKKPLVLYPNLPRLVEAVVKSLDPSSSGDRDAVLDDATEILGQVVKIYPSVDFHMASQRLCVGTGEGAVIMYDLKTATRLFVLEGHKKRLCACSFSPDGRRLATVSLEEGLVRVWKVGSSITSFFTPGAPPRQGHAGSEPFKTLKFNVGDGVHMTVTAILESVQFEWPADRTARLKIRDSAFTFST